MNSSPSRGRLTTVSLAGVAVFGALSAILTILSQFLGLNFPLVPYLQFDFGEVAIVLSLFIFGPVPALVSSSVEFVTLMAIGQNAPVGPVLKLFSMVSSIAGIWLGIGLASSIRRASMRNVFGLGTAFGAVVRAAVMTLPNYYILVFFYTIPTVVGFLSGAFKLAGISLTGTNALMLVLGFTALFNVLQLLLVMAISFTVLKVPQVNGLRIGGRVLWLMAVTQEPFEAPKVVVEKVAG
jgi:riboflavin transporter FmnP